MDSAVAIIVALAKAAYEATISVKDNSIHVARIHERLHWIMCRSDEWKCICDPTYNGDTYKRLKEVLENVNHVLHAASREPKTWKHKIHLFGGKGVMDAVADVEHQLCVALEDFQIDQNTFMFTDDWLEAKNTKEIMETFDMTISTSDPNITRQKELDNALEAIMDASHQVALEDHHLTKKALRKLEIDLPSLEYNENDILGGGAFSDVFSGTYRKKKVAIKRFKIDEQKRSMVSAKKIKKDAKKIAMEALLADRCGIHPNIVQIFGYHVSMTDKAHRMVQPLIVMELMSIPLFAELHYRTSQPSTFQQRFGWMRGIARALEFLHLQGIVHHDVCSLNILLDSSRTEAKLTDFGEAKVKGLNTTMSTSFVECHKQVPGTVAYKAPELFSNQAHGASRVSEMYAFGVTVWECLTRKVPHKGKKEVDIHLLATTEKGKRMLKVPRHMPHSGEEEYDNKETEAWNRLRYVASTCTARDQAKRLSASQVVREWNRKALKKQTEAISIPLRGIEGAFGSDVDVEAATEPTGIFATKSFAKSRKRVIVAGITVCMVILIIIVASTARSSSGSENDENTPNSSPDKGTQTPTHDDSNSSMRCIESSEELAAAVRGWTGDETATKYHFESMYGRIEDWCFGTGVTHMSYLFAGKSDFNEDISGWDVSSVTHMDWMFYDAANFNQKIGEWDVSSVETTESMFNGATKFNMDIGHWDTSSVKNMRMMFNGAAKFNMDIGRWSVSSVTDMSGMFAGAIKFDQDIGVWDVSSVTSMESMFKGSLSFNQDVSMWYVSSVTTMDYMFNQASAFNQDLSAWDVSSVRSFNNMFNGAENFKQNLCSWGDIISTASGIPWANNMFKDTRCFYAHQDPDFTSYSPGPFCYNCNQF